MPDKLKPEQRPDWILNSIAGRTNNVESIYKDGLAIGDFTIAEPDEYWNTDAVKKMFTTPDGKEDKDSFDAIYNKEKDIFLKLRQAEFDAVNFKDQYSTKLNKRLGTPIVVPTVDKVNPDLWGRSFGFDYYDGTGFSDKQRGIRETAIQKGGVKVGKNNFIPIEEFDGLTKFAKDKNGSYSLNSEGLPYMVPVKDGEELGPNDQVYSSWTHGMGYYGHDYEASHIGWTFAKNALGFGASTLDSLAEFPKAVLGLMYGEESKNMDSYKGIVNFENWAKKGNTSMTEEGMEGGFWSLEALTDLSQQVIWQIGGMVATGGTVGGAAKLLGAAGSAGKIGSTAGRLFMTGLAAGPMADAARENGLSARETAVLLGTTSIPLYYVTALEEFVTLGKTLGTSHRQIQDTFKKSFNLMLQKGMGNKAAVGAGATNLGMRFKNLMYQASKAPKIIGSAAGESVEESAEQLVDMGMRGLYNLYNELAYKDGVAAKNNSFQFDWVQEAKNLGHAAVGGAIGGSIAGPLMRRFMRNNPDAANDMYALAADGKLDVARDFLKKMHAQERLDYAWQDAGTGEYTDDIRKSRNEAAFNIGNGVLDYLETVYKDQQLDKLYKNNKAKAGIYRNMLETSNMGKDAAKLFAEIDGLNTEIAEMRKTEGSVNDRDIEEKTRLVDEKQAALDRIKRGEAVGDYVAEGLYNLNAIGRQKDAGSAWNMSVLSGRNFVNLSKSAPTFTEAANEKIKESNKQLEEADKSASVKNFTKQSKYTAGGKQRVMNDAQRKYNNDFDALKPHMDKLNDDLDAMGNEFGVQTDDILNPASKENALQVLKSYAANENADPAIVPLISNLIQTNEQIKAIEAAKTEEISPEIEEKDLMLNMVDRDEKGIMKNTTIPIAQKILEELEHEKAANRGGVSLYSNVDSSQDILDTIYARIAQVQANPQIIPKANQIYKANGQEQVRELTADEQVEFMNILSAMGAEAQRLNDIAKKNASSQDEQIRKAAIAKLNKHWELTSEVGNHFASTEHNEIAEIIMARNEAMLQAKNESNIEEYLSLQRELESELFKYGQDKKAAIFSTFDFPPNPNADDINAGGYDDAIAIYDYMRGVLAVDANRVWNAYRDIVSNLRDSGDILAPSDEQLIGIMEAIKGLSAQNYETFEGISGFRTAHHNTYYLDAVGGSGKTKLMAPVISGVMQKLWGGKVFLSAYMGAGTSKKVNLQNSFINYFKQNDNTQGIDLEKSALDVKTFIEKEAGDTNLIVFDEVTLLSTLRLDELQEVLDIENGNRQAAGKPLLKVLFLGDSNQNSPGQSKTSTEQIQGIQDNTRHLMARSEPLTFSFRAQNDQLRSIGDWSRDIQDMRGETKPRIFLYQRSQKDGDKGVVITDKQSDFDREAGKIVDRLKTTKNLSSAVYISDKNPSAYPAWVLQSKIKTLRVEEAQGEEWDYVFYDPENGRVFGKEKNIIAKKKFHTAATRPNQFFMANLEEPNIKSKEGTVYQVIPVTPSKTTKKAQLDRVKAILKNAATEQVETTTYTYDEFKDTYVSDEPPTSKSPTSSETGNTEETPTKPNTSQGFVSEWIKTRNSRDEVSLFTFFTVEGQEDTKKRALFDNFLENRSNTGYEYMITIAKNGSPMYENYVNDNPDFHDTYALFVEGIVDGQRAVLGVLPSKDLEAYIEENNVLQGQESISINIDKNFLNNARGFKPVFKTDGNQKRPLAALKEQYGDSVTFGEPRVVTQEFLQSQAARDGDKDATAKAGDIIIPISIAYRNKQEIADSLVDTSTNDFVVMASIERAYVPIDTMLEELSKFRKEDGKFDMDKGGKVYATFWSHDTRDRDTEDGRKVGRIVEAINSIHAAIPVDDVDYKNFVARYTRHLTNSSELSDSGLTAEQQDARQKEFEEEFGQVYNYTEASWIPVRYMDALVEGNQVEIANFERLLGDIQETGVFKDKGGFRFNPRGTARTTQSPGNDIHMPAQPGMDELYDKYLITNITSIDHPAMQISKDDLAGMVSQGKVNDPLPTDESVSSEGKSTDTSDNLRNNDDEVIDNNVALEDPETATLLDFQRVFFPDAKVKILPEAISRFKRLFYKNFFNLNTATIVPTDQAVRAFRDELGKQAIIPEEELNKLNIIDSPQDRAKYIDHVLYKNFGFLMGKYAPTVKQDRDGVYKFESSHRKNRSFGEKESFSLLKEGMTEMVKTQLENTPIVRKLSDGSYESTGRYLDIQRDVEEIVDAFKNARTNNNSSIRDILQNSNSEVLQSIYVRYYANDKVNIDGADLYSLSAFKDINIYPVVDAMSVFFLSGEIYNLASVELDEAGGRSKIPHNKQWRKPNEIRQHGQDVVARTMNDVKKGVASINITRTGKSRMYNFNGHSFIKGRLEKYSTEQTLAGLHAIGMLFVTEEHLNEMMLLHADAMLLPTAPREGQADPRIAVRNKYLMDNVVFPSMDVIKSGKMKYINAEIVYRTVATVDGLNTSMATLNVGGNRVYRLRNTAPLFSFNKKLNEQSTDERFSNHMFKENGRYNLTDFYLKDGFKYTTKDGMVKNTSNNDLSWEETLEYDLLWGFADTIKQTDDGIISFAMSAMVYSDGSSDVTPIIKMRDGKSSFDTKAITEELFNSRVAYYTKVEKDLINKWNEILDPDYRSTATLKYPSLATVQNAVRKRKFKTFEIARRKGMMKNLHYTDVDGIASINPLLAQDIGRYKTGKLAGFEAELEAFYGRFAETINGKGGLDERFNLKKRLSERINKDPDEVMRAFYYNWVAVSSEISTLTMGNIHQYKGKNETEQFVDFTKRAKANISNHSMQVLRDDGWEAERQYRLENNIPLDEKFLNEGMKLSRNYKVVYTTDPRVDLESFAGETKSQEVYDGATFVTPLTRIFQVASNGGKHGTNVSHVMKNITTAINQSGTTFIKHAEFEFTIPLMREGTQRIADAVQGMLSPKFDTPVELGFDEEGKMQAINSAWGYLTKELGVNEDLSNVTQEHFQELAEFLVDNGVQDAPVMELIPSTSVKTGGGAVNNMEISSQLRNPVTEILDIYNKGTQLDASHDPTEGLLTTATSQLFNTIGLNWRNPEETLSVLEGLAELAGEVNGDYSSLDVKSGELIARLKNLVRVAQDTDNQALGYQQKLIETDYSIDDRQILNRVVSLLNADITKRGIAPKFQGGSYVVHPANGLIKVYENGDDGTISLKSKRRFTDDEGRDLVFHAPTYTSKTADALKRVEQMRITAQQNLTVDATELDRINLDLDYEERVQSIMERDVDGTVTTSLTETPQYRRMIAASKRGDKEALLRARNEVDNMLQAEEWEAGYAEIILPTEMQRDFGLEAGIDLNDITQEYFKKQIRDQRKADKMDPLKEKALSKRSADMFQGFQKRLEGLMIRIPTTGKHSALPTRVVAFMDGSDNSVFVPAELLMLQGADQDYDKGSYLTYESVAGFIPTVSKDESGEYVLDPKFKAIPKWRTVQIDPNYVTKVLGGSTANIDTTMYKDLLRHQVKKGIAVRLNQHDQAKTAGIKNGIVDKMRQIIADPKNAVEASISVDNILAELRDIRDSINAGRQFFKDDYVSYAQMHEENQSGVSLTGIFANAGKAYQVMYTAFKTQGFVDNSILAGLSPELGSTQSDIWARFAALTNAAVDGAKEQILGTLGIRSYNANMVAYMVATGSTSQEIADMLTAEENQEFMTSLKNAARYDSDDFFYDPTEEWGQKRPDLVALYKKGQEYSVLARGILNRKLPSTPQDMYAYKENIESFVNKSFKDGGVRATFNYLQFLESDSYAQIMVDHYQKLLGKDNHQFNILNVLLNSPHVRAYTKLFNTSVKAVKATSNISRLSFNVADKVKRRVNSQIYQSINEFIYGVGVEQYMKGRTSSNGKFDLGTIEGRNNFVAYMGNTGINGFISNARMKPEYSDNVFIQRGLFVEDVPRYKYEAAPQLRTYEINNMEEQQLLTLQVGFDMLSDADKADLVNYNLITRKGAMGRGSIAQLFDPSDTAEFSEFLKTFDNSETQRLANIYESFRSNAAKTSNFHNSIPYSLNETVKAEEKAEVVPAKTQNKTIKDNHRFVLNDVLTKLNNVARSSKPNAPIFRTIPANAPLDVRYAFYEGLPSMTSPELILYVLGNSKNLKPAWKSKLENTYKGMTGKKVTNSDIAKTIKRCK